MGEDITFCGYSKCPNKKCERHQSNIKNFDIPHSFAYFHDCDKYPPMEFSQEEQRNLKIRIMENKVRV